MADNEKSRAAEMRARRWKANPLKSYVYRRSKGSAIHLYTLKPVDDEMSQWITAKDIRLAKRECNRLNQSVKP